jgi:cyclopropane-fatty-acyl-phospholipid synthase
VRGITISASQLAVAKKRIQESKLEHLVSLGICDYRDVTGTFDAVVSIEMFEAVGEKFWPDYFKVVNQHLKTGGRALIQTITIDESRFERYRSSTDFIQQYIFPGGMLPSPIRFEKLANTHGLIVQEAFAFGKDYAETLRHWRLTFDSKIHRVSEQGFGEKFQRIWNLYFAYCESGFEEACTDVFQFELRKIN